MFHTPILLGPQALFQQIDNEIYPQNRGRYVRLMPIGASACSMAAFSGFMKALDLLHQAMRTV